MNHRSIPALAAWTWMVIFLGGACSSDNSGSEDVGEGHGTGSADSDSATGTHDTGGQPTGGEIDTEQPEPSDADSTPAVSEDTGSDTMPVTDSPLCPPLPAATGNTITVTPDQASSLQEIVQNAAAGDTIALADGTYSLNGAYLWMGTPRVTLRSVSGDREAVIIDGGYQTTEIVTVAASDIIIADLTLTRAYTHPIHVVSTDAGDTLNTLIYNVHIVDPREQAIKINPHEARVHFTDNGTVACSLIELTDTGRPEVNPTSGGCYTGGVDAHAARGWTIRDNVIQGFYCPEGLSEHAVHLWRGCRETVVERNRLIDNARGVGFGLADSGEARTYDDNPCPGAGYVGHYLGIVRNNFVVAQDPGLFQSSAGFDCGVCLWSACEAKVLHNTIVSTGDSFSSIEGRFSGSRGIVLANNIVSHEIRERDGADQEESGTLRVDPATDDLFVDLTGGDLHLRADAAAAIDQGDADAIGAGECDDDIDGESREDTPDIGADEVQ